MAAEVFEDGGAELVVQVARGEAELGADRVDRRQPGAAHELRAEVGRGLAAQREDVAVAGRIEPVEADVGSVLAGVDRAAVVQVDRGRDTRRRRDLDGEIGLADLLAGRQRRAHRDAAQVAEREERALDQVALGDRVAAQDRDDPVHELGRHLHARLDLQRDRADAALEDLDDDDAIAEALLRHVGLRQEQALTLQRDLDILGGVFEVSEGLVGAGVLLQQRQQRVGTGRGQARDPEALHRHLRAAARRRRRDRARHGEHGLRAIGRGLGNQRGLDLLQDRAGVGLRRGLRVCGALDEAECRQRDAERKRRERAPRSMRASAWVRTRGETAASPQGAATIRRLHSAVNRSCPGVATASTLP